MLERKHPLLERVDKIEKLLNEDGGDMEHITELLSTLYQLLRVSGVEVSKDKTHNLSQIRAIVEKAIQKQTKA